MIGVLLVLLALFVLCAPFLMSARSADRSAARQADRASTQLALDAATRHVRARLRATHPGIDLSRHTDSLAEIHVDNEFPPEFLRTEDASGILWDLQVRDVAGLIDLQSAPPTVIGNALGVASFLTRDLGVDDDELSVADGDGFEAPGLVRISGETVAFSSLQGRLLGGLARGLGHQLDEDDQPVACGPRPPMGHPRGRQVLGVEAWSLAEWRVAQGVELRRLDGAEALRGIEAGDGLREVSVERLARSGSVFGDVGSGPRWQKPARLVNSVAGGLDCTLLIDRAGYFNPGTTVKLVGPGGVELALVESVSRGRLRLTGTVEIDHLAWDTLVYPLARRPVNINTAPPEVLYLLLLNLQLAGSNDRVTPTEAEAMVARLVSARPFGRGMDQEDARSGLRDLLERVLLPAAGLTGDGSSNMALIDRDDMTAIYRNAVNANDGRLSFSTMPFSFVTVGVVEAELRAVADAQSGARRAQSAVNLVELVVPQGDLLQLWTSQNDFYEGMRLYRDAPGWATGPEPTSRTDANLFTDPPSRVPRHMGQFDSVNEEFKRTFAAHGEDGFAMPWVAEVDEAFPRNGRVEHFRGEVQRLEGRYLPEQLYTRSTSDGVVGWAGQVGLLRAFDYSFWFEPEGLAEGDVLFDLGGLYDVSDRVSVLVEQGDLVVRVLDAAGDHPDTSFNEAGEWRMALAPGETSPGLPGDTWHHLDLDVRGNRGEQITVLYDGAMRGRTPSLTELDGGLSDGQTSIRVESTEGFPAQCVIRIGQELMEVFVEGPTSFRAEHVPTGIDASFGGRLARERMDVGPPVVNLALGKRTDHADGTPVHLYGYSTPLTSNAPQGRVELPADIGAWGLARVTALVGPGDDQGDPILLMPPANPANPNPSPVQIGTGIEATTLLTGLELAPVDATHPDIMGAFNAQGGYAVMMQRAASSLQIGTGDVPLMTVNGTPIFGMEVVYYSGVQGNTLMITQRHTVASAQLQNVGSEVDTLLGPERALIQEFCCALQDPDTYNDALQWQIMVAPISLPAPGNAGEFDFLLPGGNLSEYVQLTRVGDAEFTEWVRYDEIANQQFVRDEQSALQTLYNVAVGQGGQLRATADPGGGPGGPGGGGGGPGAGGGDGIQLPGSEALSSNVYWSPGGVGAGAPAEDQWEHELGESEDETWIVTRAVGSQFQFRGVMGTFSHAHPQGTPILPVFRVRNSGEPNGGQPGRRDAAFIIDADPSNPLQYPVRLHHTYRPNNHRVYSWSEGGLDSPAAGPEATAPDTGVLNNAVYVALQDKLPLAISSGQFQTEEQINTVAEMRLLGRLVMFPSGERPRAVPTVQVGGSVMSPGSIPAAVVDELVFGSTQFAQGTNYGDSAQGAPLLLAEQLLTGDTELKVGVHGLRIALGTIGVDADVLDFAPEDAGLMRIGSEILGYTEYDAEEGLVTLAANGRGLMGSAEQPHELGEVVYFLTSRSVSELTGPVTADSPLFPLEDLEGFAGSGTARIDDELVHWTRQRGSMLEMPARSTAVGAFDGQGSGMFRGRYGSVAGGHPAGTLMIHHPFRYWDRWAEHADAPELAYYGLHHAQDDAFWRRAFWVMEPTAHAGPRLGLLMRADPTAPWDAVPEEQADLFEMFDDDLDVDRQGAWIGGQSDRLEFRVFVRHEPGSFDALEGTAHGWKGVPELQLLGLEYFAPGRTLRRAER